MFLEGEERDEPVVLLLDDHPALLPAVGREVNVAEPPVVVLLADAGDAGHGVLVLLDPAAVGQDRLARRLRFRDELRVVLGEFFRDPLVDARLPRGGPDRDRCQIGSAFGQVGPGLLVDLRHRPQGRPVFLQLALVERRLEFEEGPEARHRRTGAALGHQVEGRVPGPGPGHTVVEVEPVHLGADEVVIDLVGDRPVGDLDCREPALVVLQALPLPLHRVGGVVGHAAVDLGLLEDAELLEELQQVVVCAGRGVLGGGGRRAAGDRQREQGGQREQEGQRSKARRDVPHDGELLFSRGY